MHYPDYSKPFYLTTDASGDGIGSVLSQDIDGNELPLAYASRALNKAEANYSTTEQELLAILWSVKHFRPYLYGRHFYIITDHKPLIWLFNVKDPGSRLMRWRIKLEEYQYEIKHKPGKQNANADALSRSPNYHINVLSITVNKSTDSNCLIYFITRDLKLKSNFWSLLLRAYSGIKELLSKCLNDHRQENFDLIQHDKGRILFVVYAENQLDCITIQNLEDISLNLHQFCLKQNIQALSFSQETTNIGITYDKFQQTISHYFRTRSFTLEFNYELPLKEADKLEIIHEYHDTVLAGHRGVKQTIKRIRKQFNWPTLKKDVQNYIKSGETCQKVKARNKTLRQPMIISTTSSKAFDRVYLDIVGPLPESVQNNKYVLTLQDDLTKFSLAFAIPTQDAETIAKVFVENVICLFGTPKSILTDQGANFLSTLFKNVCKLLNIEKLNTTPYHPQTNGALERSHRTLTDYIKSFIDKDIRNWDTLLPYYMLCYNSTEHTSTNYPPFQLMFGREFVSPSSFKTVDPLYNYDDYYFTIKNCFQRSWQIGKANIDKSKQRSKIQYDKKTHVENLHIGDQVLIQNNQTKNKLDCKWLGPYEIQAIHDNENITVNKNGKPYRVHKNITHKFY